MMRIIKELLFMTLKMSFLKINCMFKINIKKRLIASKNVYLVTCMSLLVPKTIIP